LNTYERKDLKFLTNYFENLNNFVDTKYEKDVKSYLGIDIDDEPNSIGIKLKELERKNNINIIHFYEKISQIFYETIDTEFNNILNNLVTLYEKTLILSLQSIIKILLKMNLDKTNKEFSQNQMTLTINEEEKTYYINTFLFSFKILPNKNSIKENLEEFKLNLLYSNIIINKSDLKDVVYK